jgi:hypothetical protein
MTAIVHARLDAVTLRLLRRLKRRNGWSDSEIVRRGVRALAEAELPREQTQRKIVGLGRFTSGRSDLGSNPRYLDDFGG